jgi:hypothetical protein
LVLGGASTVAEGLAVLVLNLIRFALITTTMVWSQGTLNAYWYKVRGEPLQDAPIGAGERGLIFLGLFVWLTVILSVL